MQCLEWPTDADPGAREGTHAASRLNPRSEKAGKSVQEVVWDRPTLAKSVLGVYLDFFCFETINTSSFVK